jgi:hypothetical protein
MNRGYSPNEWAKVANACELVTGAAGFILRDVQERIRTGKRQYEIDPGENEPDEVVRLHRVDRNPDPEDVG